MDFRFFDFIELFVVQNSYNIRLKALPYPLNFIIFVPLTKNFKKTKFLCQHKPKMQQHTKVCLKLY